MVMNLKGRTRNSIDHCALLHTHIFSLMERNWYLYLEHLWLKLEAFVSHDTSNGTESI